MISLPIDSQLTEIIEKLKSNSNLILSASPGAGKTTRLPPRLIQITDKKVLVLEPRRVAAVGAAQRIAEENNWQLGDQVGYQIRFDSNVSPNTRLVFLTEALLNRKLLTDPTLKDVGIVVLDEFHERSQHVDLALGLLKELQSLERPDLKIVVMSATLNAEPISEFLTDSGQKNTEVIQVPGRIFPLKINYLQSAQKLNTGPDFIDLVCNQAQKMTAELPTGEHLLVFLPGLSEIERCFSQLENWANNNKVILLKLSGSMTLEEQRSALAPLGKTKIILATNVAESSLTIDGVTAVLDSGLQRRASINPKTGFPSLDLARISKSSATQRSGRAARQKEGICFRLWSKLDELSMTDHEQAEILRTDLAEALLFLANQGITDFNQFSWFEKPNSDSLNRAEKQLKNISALDFKNSLTDLGRMISRLPLPPRLGKLVLVSQEMGLTELGAELAALLLEKDILRGPVDSVYECDLTLRLETFRKSPNRFANVHRAAKSILRTLPSSAKKPNTDEETKAIPKILAQTFPDQICRRRKSLDQKGIMIGGRGVSLDDKSVVRKSQFFVALQTMEGLSSSDTKVSLACGITEDLILQTFDSKIKNTTWVEFDEKSEKLVKKDCRSIVIDTAGQLDLEEPRTSPASTKDVQEQLPEIAYRSLNNILKKNENLGNWHTRYQVFTKYFPEALTLEENHWRSAFSEACYGENSLNTLYEKNLIYFIEQQIPADLIHQFHQVCPETLTVPSGSKIRVQYEGANPSLEVRLQEVFGWFETPKILEGKVSLTMVLLAPNYRPVQVTQDLASFWKSGYFEVKKELKTRYPKHSWPEDPLTAMPQAKGRPRQT